MFTVKTYKDFIILPINVKSLTIDTNQLQGKHFTELSMNSIARTLQAGVISHSSN